MMELGVHSGGSAVLLGDDFVCQSLRNGNANFTGGVEWVVACSGHYILGHSLMEAPQTQSSQIYNEKFKHSLRCVPDWPSLVLDY